MRENKPGSTAYIEEHWVSAEKALENDQKKSLGFVRRLFFENPGYKTEEPEYVISQLADGQVKNMQEGALAILQADKEEVMKALEISSEQEWNRCFSAALEINKRYGELAKAEQESDSNTNVA